MAAFNNALDQNTVIPVNAARHPLVKNGRVKPLMLQPLFKEIDESDFRGRRVSHQLKLGLELKFKCTLFELALNSNVVELWTVCSPHL